MAIGSRMRRVRPVLEAMEGRALLSGAVSTPQITTTGAISVSPDQQFVYTTPQGTHVDIRLYGAGSLSGSYVDADGGLNLRFSGTNQQTGIIATVHGGTGKAPLRSLQSLTLQFSNPKVPSDSLTGVGGSLVNIVSLRDFDLVSGGRINLTSGVHALYLNSAAADTAIHLREVPEAGTTVRNSAGSVTLTAPGLSVTTPIGTLNNSTSLSSTTITSTTSFGSTSATSGGVTIPSASVTGNPVVTGTTNGSYVVGATAGTNGSAPTTNGSGVVGTTTTSATTTTTSTNPIIVSGTGTPTSSSAIAALATGATQNGQTLAYSVNSGTAAQTLSSVTGQFTPTKNIVFQNIGPGSPNPQPGPGPAPPGVVIAINRVNGPTRSGPPRNVEPLSDAAIYAYDPTLDALIEFNTATGARIRSIPAPIPTPSAAAGVALSQVNGTLLVLISDGQSVYAYNALTGASAGSFSLSALSASLARSTGKPVKLTRLGTTNNQTVLSDPTGGSTGLGLIQPIDVAASLAGGQAVALKTASGNAVAPFTETRAFGLAGGLSGVPGQSGLFATGGGYLDTAQPNQTLLGLSSLNLGNSSLSESKRTEVTSLRGTGVNTNAHGASVDSMGNVVNANNALGSHIQFLALYTGRVTNTNPALGPVKTVDQISLINPTTAAVFGTFNLDDPNPLSGLSQSFYPALTGSSLIDVQGNTQSVTMQSAQGLVFNGEGNVNVVKIHNAVDTTIVGYPFGHAVMPHRTNVTIITPTRTVDGRSGVTVVPGLVPTGPVNLPTP